MSKIIIMDIADGKVSYIKGEEVTVEIDTLKAKLNDLNTRISSMISPDYEEAIADLKKQAEGAIAIKKSETEETIAKLQAELKEFEDSINFELQDQIDTLEIKRKESDEAYSNLVRERDGIKAILDSLVSDPIDKPDPVSEDIPEDQIEKPMDEIEDGLSSEIEAPMENSIGEEVISMVEETVEESGVEEVPSTAEIVPEGQEDPSGEVNDEAVELITEDTVEAPVEEVIVEESAIETKPEVKVEPKKEIPAIKRIIF